MKNILLRSLIFACVVTVAGVLVNLVSYWLFGTLPLAITMTGGEWIGQVGFGVMLETVYAFGPADSLGTQSWLSFDAGSLITSWVVAFIAALGAQLILRKRGK